MRAWVVVSVVVVVVRRSRGSSSTAIGSASSSVESRRRRFLHERRVSGCRVILVDGSNHVVCQRTTSHLRSANVEDDRISKLSMDEFDVEESNRFWCVYRNLRYGSREIDGDMRSPDIWNHSSGCPMSAY